MYQISRQSANLFSPYGNFHTLKKRREKKEKKTKETKPIFESLYMGTSGTISLKFGLWGTDGEGISST